MRDPNIMIAVISGLLGGGFIGGLVGLIQFFVNRADRKKERAERKADEAERKRKEAERDRIDPDKFNKLIELTIAQAQDRIYYLGKQYIKTGYITIHNKAIYKRMYNGYKELGGNSYGKEIYDAVMRLDETTEDGTPVRKSDSTVK